MQKVLKIIIMTNNVFWTKNLKAQQQQNKKAPHSDSLLLDHRDN